MWQSDEVTTSVWVVRGGFSEEVTFRLRGGWQERASHITVAGRRALWENRTVPSARKEGSGPGMFRTRKKTSMAGVWKGRRVKVWEVGRGQITEGMINHESKLDKVEPTQLLAERYTWMRDLSENEEKRMSWRHLFPPNPERWRGKLSSAAVRDGFLPRDCLPMSNSSPGGEMGPPQSSEETNQSLTVGKCLRRAIRFTKETLK